MLFRSYSYVYSRTVIEHLFDIEKVLKELHRICKDEALILIITTYFNNYTSYSSVEHLHHFNKHAFLNVNIEGLELVELKLVSSKIGLVFPFRGFLSKYIPNLIKQIHITYKVKK